MSRPPFIPHVDHEATTMKFLTLGPAGSNHEFVAHRYLDFHGISERATLELVPDFEQGAAAVLSAQADFLIQCAVHPATVATVAKFFHGLYVIDTFISASRDLAIVQRNDVTHPRTLAVMQPTLDYIDAKRWDRIELVETVAAVTRGLVEGTYEAGLAYAAIAQAYPQRLHIVQHVGSVDDAWIVYGRTRVGDGGVTACAASPSAARYRQMA